ncbi:hypothetical protein RCG67_06620 [Kocuria sp. CPCC 205292]|uniref:hypothetical protein n=1 Tax=Kocuria cellulosilytica TaxID=3071451 RepID=UPI0034D529B7
MGAEAPVVRIVPGEAVSSVVASHPVLRRIVLTETAPVLHTLFEQDGRRRIAGVPVATHQDPAVDTWIAELRRHGVALVPTSVLTLVQRGRFPAP